MSQYFGFCQKHKTMIFDYCPECEPEFQKCIYDFVIKERIV